MLFLPVLFLFAAIFKSRILGSSVNSLAQNFCKKVRFYFVSRNLLVQQLRFIKCVISHRQLLRILY